MMMTLLEEFIQEKLSSTLRRISALRSVDKENRFSIQAKLEEQLAV
jgi:hypothetical protein